MSRSGRTQIESRKRGGQLRNQNAKKVLPWSNIELNEPKDVIRFLAKVVQATWEGQLGTRQAGAINGSLRLMLQFHDDIKRLDELNEIAEQIQQENERIHDDLRALQEREARLKLVMETSADAVDATQPS
jgi:hypothetical protein